MPTTTKLIDYDSAEHFADAEAQADLLRDAIEQRDPAYLAHAIGIVARAHGMTDLQKATGMKRQALYRAFSKEGNPTLATVMKALDALGLEIKIEKKAA